MKTRIISLLLILFIFSSFSVSANDTASSYGNALEKEQGMAIINLLSNPEHFTSDENGYISRADFLYTLSKLANIPTDATAESVYSDVDPDSFVAGCVSSNYSLGYISKSDFFNPYQPIRTTEALKLAVCVTGFKNLAEVKGGYPAGYMAVASANNLIIGDESFSGEFLSLEEAKVLIFRVMTCDYMKNSGVMADGTLSFETYDNVTLLSDIHNIFSFEGLVTATNESSLTNPSHLSDGEVEIDGVSYSAECDTSEFLGHRVKGLYRKDLSKYTIIYMCSNNNSELVLNGDDFSVSPSFKEISCVIEGKDKTFKLDNLYNFIYNGRAYPAHNNLLFGNTFATYKFVNSDDDNDFDAVYMTEEKYMKISALHDLSTHISDSNGFSPAIDISLSDIKISVNRADGTKCEWYTLPEGTVVGAAVSMDGKLIKIRELSDVVTGIAKEYDAVKSKILIDGKTYKISSYLTNEAGSLKLGEEYSLIIDGDILVALSGGISRNEVYGYMIKAAPEKSGLSGKGLIKILTENSEIKVFETAEKIKFNGIASYSYDDDTLWSLLSTRQLIKYSLNEDGKIKSVRVASAASSTPFEDAPTEENSFRKFDTPSPYYRSSTRTMTPYGRIDTAKFFVVPIDDALIEDENKFAVVAWNNARLALDNNTTYNSSSVGYVEMYDISVDGVCPVVVFKHDTRLDKDYLGASIGVVEKITSISTDTGADKKLYIVADGEYASYPIASGVSVTKPNGQSISAGDIVRYVLNSKNEITALTVDFDGKNAVMHATSVNNFTSTSSTYLSARIYSAKNGFMYLSPVTNYSTTADYSWSSLKCIRYSSAKIVVYDYVTDTLRLGSAADFMQYKDSGIGSYIVARTNQYLDTTLIVIYQNR